MLEYEECDPLAPHLIHSVIIKKKEKRKHDSILFLKTRILWHKTEKSVKYN